MNDLQVAKLLAHAINTLDHQTPDDDQPYERCCWHECAPCSVLHDLLTEGNLDDTVRPYLEAAGGTYDWWQGPAETGEIDIGWFLSRMCGRVTCPNSGY